MSNYVKPSKEEVILLERIFMLQMSVDFLKHGRRPFHKEAMKLLKKKISELKQQK